jgi:hypothetical protein
LVRRLGRRCAVRRPSCWLKIESGIEYLHVRLRGFHLWRNRINRLPVARTFPSKPPHDGPVCGAM